MSRLLLPCALALAALVVSAAAVHAEDFVPLDKQKGVRGRVIIAPELLTTPQKITGAREKALRGAATVRRPVGRPLAPLVEAPPALVVMLEGDGIRQENAELPQLLFQGHRFVPGSLVMARAGVVHIENKDKDAIAVVDESGAVLANIAGGAGGDANLKVGAHTLSVDDQPWATTDVRVLERGRVLPMKDSEIPLTDIPGGDYVLTFFFGAEPLRIQPLQVPDQRLVFIDATVSALKVVEVSIKDASMRIAVPPSGLPKEDGTP